MGNLKWMGLETKGAYCYYQVGGDSAVVVAMVRRRDMIMAVPEKIGRLIVRGVDNAYESQRWAKAMAAVPEKKRKAVEQEWAKYVPFRSLDLYQLPETVEFVAHVSDFSGRLSSGIPEHIRYIETLSATITRVLKLPNSIAYLGHVETNPQMLASLSFGGAVPEQKPHHPVSAYLGREIADVPQIEAGAFRDCPDLDDIILGDHFQKIGADAMPVLRQNNTFLTLPRKYIFHLPKALEDVPDGTFADGILSSLTYPDDISQPLRYRKLDVEKVRCLTIRGMDGLEEYTRLYSRGQAPEQHPGKCLYHLMRCAEHIIFDVNPEEIFDGMFANCVKLRSIAMAGDPDGERKDLPEGIRRIGAEAFFGCRELSLSHLPGTLTEIGARAFYGLTWRRVELPDGLQKIDSEAFRGCYRLLEINFPRSLQQIAPDAFAGCEELRVTRSMRQVLQPMPQAYQAIVGQWAKQVLKRLRIAEELLTKTPVTVESKQAAYRAYRQVLEIDPFNRTVMDRLMWIVMSYQIPHCISANQWDDLRSYLVSQESTELVAQLDSMLTMVDSISTILCDSKDIRTVRLAYCLNTGHYPAVELLEFLLGQIDAHPNISGLVKNDLQILLGKIHSSPVRNWDPELKEQYAQLRNRVARFCNYPYVCGIPTPDYVDLSLLTSVNLMKKCQAAMERQDIMQAYYDAEFWLALAVQFNPETQIPAQFRELKSRYQAEMRKQNQKPEPEKITLEEWLARRSPMSPNMRLIAPPKSMTPVLTEPEIEGHHMSEEESAYWASVAAAANGGGYTVTDLEDEWATLGLDGFWDDTSWM